MILYPDITAIFAQQSEYFTVYYFFTAGLTPDCDPGYICSGGSDTPTPTDDAIGYLCPVGHYCLAGDTSPRPCPIGKSCAESLYGSAASLSSIMSSGITPVFINLRELFSIFFSCMYIKTWIFNI